MVTPPVPGESHPFYGDLHNQHLLLPSIRKPPGLTPEDIHRHTNLINAAEHGDLGFLQRILEDAEKQNAEINIDRLAPANGQSALHLAASRGHVHMVQTLIDQCKATVDILDKEGETPLLKAAFQGHETVVQCLLQRKTNVQHRDKDGWSALHNACARGHLRVVRMLVDVGQADVNSKSKTGHTPLMNAASKGFADIVEFLLSRPETDPLARDARGDSAYDAAATHLFSNVCDLLEVAEREWWINPHGDVAQPVSGAYDVLAVHNTVLVVIHENQRAQVTLSTFFGTQPIRFSGHALSRSDRRTPWSKPPTHQPCTRDQISLPLDANRKSRWFWLTDWQIDPQAFNMEETMNPNMDSDEIGWEYARTFDDMQWFAEPIVSTGGVRRRRWIRVMKRLVDIEGVSDMHALSLQGLQDPREYMKPVRDLSHVSGFFQNNITSGTGRRKSSISLSRRRPSIGTSTAFSFQDAEPLRLYGAGDESNDLALHQMDTTRIQMAYSKYYQNSFVNSDADVLHLQGENDVDSHMASISNLQQHFDEQNETHTDSDLDGDDTSVSPETPPSNNLRSSLLTEKIQKSLQNSDTLGIDPSLPTLPGPSNYLDSSINSTIMYNQNEVITPRQSTPAWQLECDSILRPSVAMNLASSTTNDLEPEDHASDSERVTCTRSNPATEDYALHRQRSATFSQNNESHSIPDQSRVMATSLPERALAEEYRGSFLASVFGFSNTTHQRSNSTSSRHVPTIADDALRRSITVSISPASRLVPRNVPQAMNPDDWEPDESVRECRVCNRKFTMFYRRHHCNSCIRI